MQFPPAQINVSPSVESSIQIIHTNNTFNPGKLPPSRKQFQRTYMYLHTERKKTKHTHTSSTTHERASPRPMKKLTSAQFPAAHKRPVYIHTSQRWQKSPCAQTGIRAGHKPHHIAGAQHRIEEPRAARASGLTAKRA